MLLFRLLRHCGLTSAVLACLCFAAQAGAREVPVNLTSQEAGAELAAPASRAISGREAIALAKSLLDSGRPEALTEAGEIYTKLRRHPALELRLEAAFQLGQIRLRQGLFRQAASMFLEILNQNPALPRVRLELARAYFLDKNYEDAQFQFELIKGGELPPEVLTKVDAFLDAIRRQKNWTLDFSLSPVSDSNINQTSGGREECINTPFGTLCRPLEEKASGTGLSAGANVDYFWRFHQDWGLRASLGFSALAYEQDEYDDYSIYAALGPRFLWGSGEASLQPTFRKRWIGTKQYNDEYGLRLDSRRIFGRLLLDTGASYTISDYDNAYVHSVLHGDAWSLRLQPRYILNDQTFVQAGLEWLRDNTRVKSYASDNWRYSLGVYRVLPYGFSLFLEGSLTDSKYQASQWYVTKDYRIDETVRADKTWGLFSSLSSNVFERYGLTPVLQYTYTKRDSNIWSREYDRHRLNFLVNFRF